jgi:hypothetical protein
MKKLVVGIVLVAACGEDAATGRHPRTVPVK